MEKKQDELLKEFLSKEENQQNALTQAHHISTLMGNGWFTVNHLRKKLFNAKRDEIRQMLNLLEVFGLCEVKSEAGIITYRIVFKDHHKLQLLEIELAILDRRRDVIIGQINRLKDLVNKGIDSLKKDENDIAIKKI